MKQVKIVSYAFLTYIPLLAIWMVGVEYAYWGLGLDRFGNDFLGQNFYVIYPTPPIPERQIYGGLAALPVLICRLIALWFLWKMFFNFTKEKIMIGETVRLLRQYAKYSVFGVVAFFFLSGVRRWGIGEFSDMPLWTHLQLNSHEFAILFSSAIIYVASKVIEEGNKYKAETESYV